MKKKYVVPFFVPHWGCPHHCVFCDQETISGFKEHPRIDQVINTYLKNINKKKKNSIELAFYGGSFTAIPFKIQEELLKKAAIYIKSGQIDSIRISTRPDYITDEILEFLKRQYVRTIELGVQSLDDEVLKLSGRGHDSKDVFNAAKKIKHKGFILGIQLMPGLPGDNYNRTMKTVQDVIYIKPDFVRIYPTIVIKGTALEKLYNKGLYAPLSLKEAVSISAEMYKKFVLSGIKVIRLGLQPTEDLLNNNCIVAGPFHPAFGELVKGEVAYNELREGLNKFLEKFNPKREINIHVPAKKLSIYVGQKSINKIKLRNEFYNLIIKIIPDHFLNGNILISDSDEKYSLKCSTVF